MTMFRQYFDCFSHCGQVCQALGQLWQTAISLIINTTGIHSNRYVD